MTSYYNEAGEYIARPECLARIYHKLVRIEREWKHKEYMNISPMQSGRRKTAQDLKGG